MTGRVVSNKSKVSDTKVSVEPNPEEYEGYNRPYLGVVDHGVQVDSPYRQTEEDMPDHDGRLVDVYEHEETDADPIPVYLVNQSSRERRSFRPVVGYAGQQPSRILGQDETRTAAVIVNPSETETVYLGDMAETANAVSGWPLLPGQSYRTESQEDIYAYTASVDAVMVPVAVEFRRGLNG